MRRVLLTATVALVLGCTHAAAADDQQLHWALFLKPMCDKHIEGFAEKSKDAYTRLRPQHAEVVATYEANYDASNAPTAEAPVDAQGLDQLRSGCETALDFMLNEGRPIDPRLATPDQTWKLFISALRSGDKETLALCFNPGDRSKYMQSLRKMSQAELADLASSFRSFDLTDVSMEDYQRATVKTSEGTIGLVLFVRSAGGWRISQL